MQDSDRLAHVLDALAGIFVEDERLPGLEDMRPWAFDRHRLVGEAHATLDRVRELDLAGLTIDDADVDYLGVEDLLDLAADHLIHRLHVEPFGETTLNLVDDRQLGRALVGLGEQALGLAEQAGVLERHAHARCECAEQSLVGVVVGARRRAFERDDPEHPVAGQDRYAQPGFGDGAELDRAAPLCRL